MHHSATDVQIPKYLLVRLKQHKNTSKTMRKVTKYFPLLHAKAEHKDTH